MITRRFHLKTWFVCGLLQAFAFTAIAADQPQWGQAWTRNQVSDEKQLPATFDPKSGKNITWVAKIGTETHGTPIVADGRIYIGTNNNDPRDPKHQGDRGVLMCFEEATGKFLWQLVVPKREEDKYHDWPNTGWSSPVTVDGGRVYSVTSRGEVVCLDPLGMANGNDGPYKDEGIHMVPKGTNTTVQPMTPGPLDADILWLFDLTAGAGIWSHDGAHSSILVHGDYLYLNSGTGVDNTHKVIRTPDAPSLVVINKHTGRFVARDDEKLAANIFHCTWSAPSLAVVNGKPLIFFASGTGMVFAFEPISGEPAAGEIAKLKKVWQFDFDPAAPKEEVHKYSKNLNESPSNIYGMPVFANNRLYLAGGGDLWWGKNAAWLKCINPTLTGNVTKKAEIWSYPLEKHVMSTPAVYQDMVFIADTGRKFHCVDAVTGKPYWTHEINGQVWASPMVADGKVYLGTRSGNFYVFAASKEKQVLMSEAFITPISGTVTPANGVLYLATMKELLALKEGIEPPAKPVPSQP